MYKAPWMWNNLKKVIDTDKFNQELDSDENFIKLILKKSLLNAQNQDLEKWESRNHVDFGPVDTETIEQYRSRCLLTNV